MAWIESHQELRSHPKMHEAMRLLRVDRATAIGHLHLLWWWALDYAEDGNLTGFTPAQVAAAAEWPGKPGAFYRALVRSGFVNVESDTVTLHDWWDYAGKLVARRQGNKRRAKDHRDRVRHPVYDRDGGRCRYCDTALPIDGFIADHVFPYIRGGDDSLENLATACLKCNVRKGGRTPEEAGMTLLPLRNALRDATSALRDEGSASRHGATEQNRTVPTEQNQPKAKSAGKPRPESNGKPRSPTETQGYLMNKLVARDSRWDELWGLLTKLNAEMSRPVVTTALQHLVESDAPAERPPALLVATCKQIREEQAEETA